MSLLNTSLHELDPDVAAAVDAELAPPAVHPRDDRLGELRSGRRHGGPGLGPHQQVRRGLPRPPLLRRLRARRRRRAASPSTASRRSSAPRPRTSSRTRARRPTPPRCSRCCKPGDTILGLDLAHGGHLTHGMKINFSGKLYNVVAVPRRRRPAASTWPRSSASPRSTSPKLIVAGWSAYPRQLDFAEFRRIADEVGAYLMVDMAHFAGLVAAGLHPSPGAARARRRPPPRTRPSAARAAASSCPTQELAKKINSAVFPGQQGGPLEHVIAAKAVSFKVAALDGVQRAPAAHPGRRPRSSPSAWSQAGRRPRSASPSSPAARTCTWSWSTCATPSWTASRPRTGSTRSASRSTATPSRTTRGPPMVTSGLRIGTPALATRGFRAEDFTEVADDHRRAR